MAGGDRQGAAGVARGEAVALIRFISLDIEEDGAHAPSFLFDSAANVLKPDGVRIDSAM